MPTLRLRYSTKVRTLCTRDNILIFHSTHALFLVIQGTIKHCIRHLKRIRLTQYFQSLQDYLQTTLKDKQPCK